MNESNVLNDNNQQIDKEEVSIISIQSGKGGTGKTLISASIGFLLAHCGHRTLLIDLDIITRGLSFYLMSDEPFRAKYGFYDYMYRDKILSEKKLIRIRSTFCNSNLFFLPSSSNLDSYKIDEYPIDDFRRILENTLNNLYSNAIRELKFKYIICDVPGGTSPISYTVANTVDGYVIITEADKTSWDVTELLINGINQYGKTNQLPSKKYNPAKLGFVLNKNTLPEKEIVKFLKQRFLCRDLSVIPLDIEAVRCFQNDEIPIEKNLSSVFSECIVEIVENLYHPEQEWKDESKQLFVKIKSIIKEKRFEIEKQKRVSEKMDNFRQFVGPATVAIISLFAAAFTFTKAEFSRTTMFILLVFIGYMATLSAILSNPKFIKIIFKKKDKNIKENEKQ